MTLRLGTRGSELAMTQSGHVADQLRALGHDVELVVVKTTGDVNKASLSQQATLGVFAAELRQSILRGDVDFAVHSLKDLPVAPVEGLTIAAIPARADHRDILHSTTPFTELPAGARIGTGSPRRVAQLRRLRPDLAYVDIRGNIGTRLARVAPGDMDAIALAAAGLHRLGREEVISEYLDILPSPGQGALGVECRSDNVELLEILGAIDDAETRAAVEAERNVLALLGGGCAAPIAALARDGELRAAVFATDGTDMVEATVPMGAGAAEAVVKQLFEGGAAKVTELGASRESRLEEFHDDAALWGGEASLAGVRVLLPREDGALADGIRASGAEVMAVPLTERAGLRIAELPSAEWWLFTSPGAVTEFFDRFEAPEGRYGCVGEATAEALRAKGVEPEIVGGGNAVSLAAAMPEPVEGTSVCIPGSALSAPTLRNALGARGYDVEAVPLYTTRTVRRAPEELKRLWEADHFDVVVITAGSVGKAVQKLLGWRDQTSVVALGTQTAADLQNVADAIAETPDAAGVVRAIAGLRKA